MSAWQIDLNRPYAVGQSWGYDMICVCAICNKNVDAKLQEVLDSLLVSPPRRTSDLSAYR